MTEDRRLPAGVTSRKGRLFFASMRQRGSNWVLHVFAALGFSRAATALKQRHVRAWLEENRDVVEVER